MLLVSFYYDTKVFKFPKMASGLKVVYMVRLIAPSFNFFCTLLALNYLPISIYTVIFQTNPFLISLAAYVFLNSQICRGELIAMVICFAAVIAICLDKSSDDGNNSTLSPED